MKKYILAIAILFAASATTFAQTKTADTAKAKPATHKTVKSAVKHVKPVHTSTVTPAATHTVTPVKKDTAKKTAGVGVHNRQGDKNKI